MSGVINRNRLARQSRDRLGDLRQPSALKNQVGQLVFYGRRMQQLVLVAWERLESRAQSFRSPDLSDRYRCEVGEGRGEILLLRRVLVGRVFVVQEHEPD